MRHRRARNIGGPGNLSTLAKEPKTGPRFKDYRTTTDGVMIADIGFKKQLWALDPELDVVWDWQSSKWEIWKFPGQSKKPLKKVDWKSYHVMTVQTKKRTFRELGADILLKLQQGDPHRYTLKEFVAYFDQLDENVRRGKEKAFTEKLNAMHRETFWYHRGLRKSVPQSYHIKPSEERLLLKVSPPEKNPMIFKPSATAKIANAVTGGSINA
jgi:hypothetical protein